MSARMTQHAPNTGTAGDGRPTRRAAGAAAHSLRIGRLFGIPLQLHWSFLLLVGLVVAAEWPGGTGAIVGGLFWVAALFACVIAHELAHCLLARRRGGTVLGILLLPIGGMSRMERIPDRPADEAAIAAIGPATSLALAGLFLSVGALLGSSVWPPTLMAGSWWARLGWLNLLLGVFNLLPALPLDGGRVLRAALAQRLPRFTATRVAASVARVLAVGLLVVGFFYDFWLILIGLFVFLGASGEESLARADELAQRQSFGPPGQAWWSGWPAPPGPGGAGGSGPPGGGGGWYPPAGAGPNGGYPPAGWGPNGWSPPAPPGRPDDAYRGDPRSGAPAPDPGSSGMPGGWTGWHRTPSGVWWAGTWWPAPDDAGSSSAGPAGPTPGQGPSWAPPWGQQPSPRNRSAIDVAVERRGADPAGGEPLGEGVGEHD